MDKKIARERRLFEVISSMMNIQTTGEGVPVTWFFCFGTLFEFIDTHTFSLDYDIDIGVLYDQCDTRVLMKTLPGYGYELTDVVLHDIDKRPLNFHMKSTIDKDFPELDIYAWVRSGNLYYHTYDVKHEGGKILSQYIFKGVPVRHISPPKDEINRIRGSRPEYDILLSKAGVWNFDIYGDHSGYQFKCPFEGPSLIDIWYPGYPVSRKMHKGPSVTRPEWVKKVGSCKNL